jgi:hypothetical protein
LTVPLTFTSGEQLVESRTVRETLPIEAELPVAAAMSSDLLVDVEGRPVWPIRDEASRQMLTRIAAVYGGRLREVSDPGLHGGARPRVTGFVAALGAEAVHAGRLYAHLTGRSCVEASSLDDLSRLESVDVLVTLSRAITPPLLRWLSGPRPSGEGRATGLVFGPTEADLLRQTLLSSAHAELAGTRRLSELVTIDATVPRARAGAAHVLLGGNADCEETRRAVRAADVLTVSGHSDGVDAQLGPFVLCPMDRPAEASDGRVPQCVGTKHCQRVDLPVSDALGSGRLVSPDEVRAPVLILGACTAFRAEGGPVATRWTFAHRLHRSEYVAAICATWSVIFGTPGGTIRLSHEIAQGRPVGEALERFREGERRDATGFDMVLLGDPKVAGRRSDEPDRDPSLQELFRDWCASNVEAGQMADERLRPAALARPSSGCDREQVGFARHFAAQSAARSPDLQELATKVLASTVSTTRALRAKADTGGWRTSVDADAYRKAMLSLLVGLGFGRLHDWLSARPVLMGRSACPACGDVANRYAVGVARERGADRRLVVCPHCGVVEDAPLDAPAWSLEKHGHSYELHGPAIAPPWQGRLLVSLGGNRTWSEPWPADPEGRPRPRFSPGIAPHKLRRVALALVVGCEWIVLRRDDPISRALYPLRVAAAEAVHG